MPAQDLGPSGVQIDIRTTSPIQLINPHGSLTDATEQKVIGHNREGSLKGALKRADVLPNPNPFSNTDPGATGPGMVFMPFPVGIRPPLPNVPGESMFAKSRFARIPRISVA